MEHGQVQRHALGKAVVIHVAAPRAEKSGAKRLVLRRGDADAAEHGLQLHFVILQAIGRLGETGDAGFAIEECLDADGASVTDDGAASPCLYYIARRLPSA